MGRFTMDRRQVIARQQKLLLDEVRKLCGSGEPYALVDWPNYANPGDSAIWLGAVKVMKNATGRDPSYVCASDHYDPEDLKKNCPNGPIVIIGGGQFGDVWEGHQLFRLNLMRDFPGRRIIQLPQSIKFHSMDKAAATRDAIVNHGNFHVLVRDTASKAFCDQHLGTTAILAPDCAFSIGPIDVPPAKPGRFVFLRRLDKEAGTTDYADLLAANPITDDWILPSKTIPAGVKLSARIKAMIGGGSNAQARRFIKYNIYAQWRLDQGIKFLQSGVAVFTDRLHGMIVSTLIDRPVVVFDNNNGKVAGYYKAWLSDLKTARIVQTGKEAMSAVAEVRTAA